MESHLGREDGSCRKEAEGGEEALPSRGVSSRCLSTSAPGGTTEERGSRARSSVRGEGGGSEEMKRRGGREETRRVAHGQGLSRSEREELPSVEEKLSAHQAVTDVDRDMTRTLIANNGDINALRSSKQTPFQWAEKLVGRGHCRCESCRVVRLYTCSFHLSFVLRVARLRGTLPPEIRTLALPEVGAILGLWLMTPCEGCSRRLGPHFAFVLHAMFLSSRLPWLCDCAPSYGQLHITTQIDTHELHLSIA